MVSGVRSYIKSFQQVLLSDEQIFNAVAMIGALKSDKSLNIRLDNAKKEMLRKDEFDKIIINDEFNLACMQTKKIVTKFIQK